MRLSICHMYPDLMNTYGDRGNVLALHKRADRRGIFVEVTPVSLGDRADFDRFDLIFFGGGQDKDQKRIALDLSGEKGTRLADAARRGVVVLAVCGGYQLLGNYYRTQDGEELPGVGLFDAFTAGGTDRLTGNVVIQCRLPLAGMPTIVGFENHSGRTFLGPQAMPLGRVLAGHGNNGQDGLEGCVSGNAFGTYLHGPLLPRNPHLADYLIGQALSARYGAVTLPPLQDDLEVRAHEAALLSAGARPHGRLFGRRQPRP